MVAPPKPTFFYVLESLVGSTGAAIHLIYMYDLYCLCVIVRLLWENFNQQNEKKRIWQAC